MTFEDLVNFVSNLRRKPPVFKVMRKLGFPINKEEFRHLCATQSVTINGVPVEIGTRIPDGVTVLTVYYGDESVRFWMEFRYKRIIRSHIMETIK